MQPVEGFDAGSEEDSLNDALNCRFETLRVGIAGCEALECSVSYCDPLLFSSQQKKECICRRWCRERVLGCRQAGSSNERDVVETGLVEVVKTSVG